MYCGDETGSFIGEIGSHTCRFGYGGEDNPKLTMSSYVVSESNTTSSSSNNNNSGRRRMSRCSSLHPPREEEVMESILRSTNSSHEQPLTDPNQFLRQGEVVEKWDNVQTAWEHSMDVLRATDTRKHTQGGTPYVKKQKREHRASGLTSASVDRKEHESERERGRCVHPMLAITPGFSEYTASASSAPNNNNNNNNDSSGQTGPKFQAAIKRQQQSKHIELLMESLDATSVFLAPAPMLAAFSMGRQTALVVDIGAGGCRVTPIVDGLVLKQSQRRSGRGGDWLGNVTWMALLEETKKESPSSSPSSEEETRIKPRYMLPAETTKTKKLSPVFHRRAMNDLMYEIRSEPFVTLYNMDETEKIRIPFGRTQTKTTKPTSDGDVVMASPPRTPESGAAKNAATANRSPESAAFMEGGGGGGGGGESSIYELPDGTPIDLTSSSFGRDLCQLPELLFAEESALPFRTSAATSSTTTSTPTLSNLPLHKLIRDSLLSVGDADARKELAGCICLVGATSLLPNLEKRLSQELTALLPSFVRPKVVAPKISSVERSCASWIGASILTSLGSFQQLWLSRTEYEEYGAALSIQRFP